MDFTVDPYRSILEDKDIMVLTKRGGIFLPADLIDNVLILKREMSILAKALYGSGLVKTNIIVEISGTAMTVSGDLINAGQPYVIPDIAKTITNPGTHYYQFSISEDTVSNEERQQNNFFGSTTYGEMGATRLISVITLTEVSDPSPYDLKIVDGAPEGGTLLEAGKWQVKDAISTIQELSV